MVDARTAELHSGPYQGNLLNAAVRREITDLNRLFLEHALDTEFGAHAWFCLPACAVARLRNAAPEVRERAAHWPCALFELRLPGPTADAVAEAGAETSGIDPRAEARRAFGVTALGVLRRLAEGVPLAPRIAFGLEPAVELRLAAMSLSESYRVAAWPGLIRPRWPGHDRYWALLADAAIRGESLQWACATGLCLNAQCERQSGLVAYGPRRPARGVHRRSVGPASDLSC